MKWLLTVLALLFGFGCRNHSVLDRNYVTDLVYAVDGHAKCTPVFEDSATCELTNGARVYCWLTDTGSAADRWGCVTLSGQQTGGPAPQSQSPAPTTPKGADEVQRGSAAPAPGNSGATGR